MSQGPSIVGGWVVLEPISEANRKEAARLDAIRQRTPNLGGAAAGRRDGLKAFGPAMLIRARHSGLAIGLIENGEMAGYPGVAVVLIFTDPAEAGGRLAVEAFVLYVARLFANGAALVHVEVLEFNQRVLRMARHVGLHEQVRMRDQVYAGGRFWDVIVFAADHGQWSKIFERYQPMLPGGDRRSRAATIRRRPTGAV
jgi:hypothetical protein